MAVDKFLVKIAKQAKLPRSLIIAGTSAFSLLKVILSRGRIQPNDLNKLIKAIRNDLDRLKFKYTKAAKKYRQMASEPAEESLDAFEAYFDSLEDLDVAMEGTNADALKAWKSLRSSIKSERRAMKSAIKEKKWSEAADHAENCAKSLGEINTTIKNLPNSVVSAVISDVLLVLIVAASTALIVKKILPKIRDSLYRKTSEKELAERDAALNKYLDELREEEKKIAENMKSIDPTDKYHTALAEMAAKQKRETMDAIYGQADSEIAQKYHYQFNMITFLFRKLAQGITGMNALLMSMPFAKTLASKEGKITPNDMNALVRAVSADVNRLQQQYVQKAKELREMAAKS